MRTTRMILAAIVLAAAVGCGKTKTEAVREWEKGGQFHDKGDFDKAIVCHTKAIRLKPDFAMAYNDRAAAVLLALIQTPQCVPVAQARAGEASRPNIVLIMADDMGFFTSLDDDRVRDVFGVVWDRRVDRDIGNVEGCVLPKPSMAGYKFPDPLNSRFFERIGPRIRKFPDRFRVF